MTIRELKEDAYDAVFELVSDYVDKNFKFEYTGDVDVNVNEQQYSAYREIHSEVLTKILKELGQ